MSTYFGYPVINPFRSMTPRGFYDSVKGHTGVDINCPMGTEISLPIPATVHAVRQQSEMGLTLYLEDEVGRILVFAHLSEVLVEEGDAVAYGDVFARSGNSGSATTGPHLHFEVIAHGPEEGYEMMTRTLGDVSGYNIDPIRYLETIFSPHWSDEAMAWAREHRIIHQHHHPDEPMTWGEFAVASQRLAERLVHWTRRTNP